MKANIHPTTHNTPVTCVCGNSFTTISTEETLHVDICAQCHPFFTGDMRFVDRQGRVDRFRKQMERAQKAGGKSGKKSKTDQADDSKSYKELLEEQKQTA